MFESDAWWCWWWMWCGILKEVEFRCRRQSLQSRFLITAACCSPSRNSCVLYVHFSLCRKTLARNTIWTCRKRWRTVEDDRGRTRTCGRVCVLCFVLFCVVLFCCFFVCCFVLFLWFVVVCEEGRRGKKHSNVSLHREFAKQFSIWNPPSHAAGAHPHNCMVEQPRNQVSEMHFDKFSNPQHLSASRRV